MLTEDLDELRRFRRKLEMAVDARRSTAWCLRLWSRFVKARDLSRCVCCSSTRGIQAHHIVRRTLYPWGSFASGNGITLCRECHNRVHAESNGRADLTQPLGAGDDQDEWAFLFGLLMDDATQRGLDHDEFYFLDDHMLKFFVNVQGYDELYAMVMRGDISRVRYAHEIWRNMPKVWYTDFVSQLIQANLT
ncbi:endonuclease [Burkholderia stabilis]|uniref:HNH endonuclease n=1 Tax=Burkholderia stabilis TaxID=95485 RepID=UPI000851DA08|nr:HNH endonuclease [Burkholderia stabilis]AOR68304.1 endonuclease [Burkholderia stabilis]HDR9495199.1 HNH endonuclease [Burkholderia stabilis]HDR9526920.1 HNH endonuclease [Burkholderia stabilis]HDR9534266.1 HNH endonuclease [Burkholderia stabilis]HDR9542543.1 HNH endonuclease [Burkholderia stabilis]